jgi:hypothetical protein
VPVAPAYATLSNPAGTTYAGTKVSYTCNAGYQISGATTVSELTCLVRRGRQGRHKRTEKEGAGRGMKEAKRDVCVWEVTCACTRTHA